ncbi:MAG: hypothetical protein II932_01785 [Treponema sp.]|nr:hypothetical protein [Treponema sp.]
MEELRSTEALDNEIRNEARKRVGKILESARENAQTLKAGVEKKLTDAVAEAERQSAVRLELYRKNIDASIPLEKGRYLVSFIYDSVMDAVNAYLASIGEDRRLAIVTSLVERSKPFLQGKELEATVVGFNLAAAKAMLKKQLGTAVAACSSGEAHLLADEGLAGLQFREGILLKAKDASVNCRLTLDEKMKEILDEKSFELSSTLFGGRLPE